MARLCSLLSLVLLVLGTMWAQGAIVPDSPERVPAFIQSWSGRHEVQLKKIQPETNITAVLLADPATIGAAERIRTGIVQMHADLGRVRVFKLALWTAQGMQSAGPFKTRTQLLSAWRELTALAAASPLTLTPDQFWTQLPHAA